MTRCSARIKSQNRYKPVCKKSASPHMCIKNYCYIHAKQEYSKTCIFIQKIYRGHYYRGKLQRLFINLPRDCQQLVLFYLKQSVYYDRYVRTIQNILTNKYNSYLSILQVPPIYNYSTETHIINLEYIHNVYSAFNACNKCAPITIYNNLFYNIKNGYFIMQYLKNLKNNYTINHEINTLITKIQIQYNIMLYGYNRNMSFI